MFQGEDIPKRIKKARPRECKLCKRKLPSDYDKLSCKSCREQVLAEESPSILSSMKEMIREEIKNSLRTLQADLPSTSSTAIRDSSSEEEAGPPGMESDDSVSDSSSSDDSASDRRPSDVNHLLKAVRATMALEDPKEERSQEDKMFEELESKKGRVFPIHKNILNLINREWKHPDKGIFSSKSLKRRYPFDEEKTASWSRPPKLDVSIAKVSKKSALPFDDGGTLQDPLEKKQDTFLKKAWEAAAASFKPNIAASCVARSLSVWLEQLEDHIRDKTPREALLASIPTLKNAASFLKEASTDGLKLSAKAAALSNSARRALWIKKWSGDVGSKSKLCSIPCEGEFLFGSVLDDLLQKAGDKAKGFPTSFPRRQPRPFRDQRGRRSFDKRRQDSQRGKESYKNPKKSRGFLFSQRKKDPQ